MPVTTATATENAEAKEIILSCQCGRTHKLTRKDKKLVVETTTEEAKVKDWLFDGEAEEGKN